MRSEAWFTTPPLESVPPQAGQVARPTRQRLGVAGGL